MNRLDFSRLRPLLTHRASHCVSIYMPTHRAGTEIKQDPIRLKNLLGRAEQALAEAGLSGSEAHQRLGPAYELVEDLPFWQHQERGLALFLDGTEAETLRLDLELPEQVMVHERFHVLPLLPALGSKERFDLLALSQNGWRFIEADADHARPAELQGAPESFETFTREVVPQRDLQLHTGRARGPGAATFHGQGVGVDDKEHKRRLYEYCRQIDQAILRLRAGTGTPVPLLVAADKPLAAIYHDASDHPRLLEELVTGNPDHRSVESLHREALERLGDRLQEDRRQAEARYRQLRGSDRVRAGAAAVAGAACQGCIQTLFLDASDQRWGRVDPATAEAQTHPRREPGDEELLDYAAVQTLLGEGRVYALDRQRMPEEQEAAAILRYPLPAAQAHAR